MPNINIYEIDSTITTSEEIGSNVVYIPGYATYGPVNEPVLCTNLNQFQSIFGNAPYQFEETVSYTNLGFDLKAYVTGSNFVVKGDYEKSFIMAEELLKQGLPVMFERVMKDIASDNKVEKFTANITEREMHQTEDTAEVIQQNISSGKYYVQVDNSNQTSREYLVATKYTEGTQYYDMTGSKTFMKIKAKYPGDAGSLLKGMLILNSNNTFTLRLYPIDDSLITIEEIIEQTFSLDYNPDYPLYSDIENTEIGKYITLENVNITDIQNAFVEPNTFTQIGQEFRLSIDKTNLVDEFEFTPKDIYDKFSSDLFDKFNDPMDLPVKIITTGAYPIFEYTNSQTDYTKYPMYKLVKATAQRGDACYIIDSTYYSTRQLSGINSVYGVLNSQSYEWINKEYVLRVNVNKKEVVSKYGTILYDWSVFNISTVPGLQNLMLPASFAYLYDLAISIQNGNSDALAIAGVNRGLCQNLIRPSQKISNALCVEYQNKKKIAINPIVYQNTYGYCIWGNRTLLQDDNGLKATSFLNVRMMCCDIKKEVNRACKKLTFENNSQVLWVNFKSLIEPILDKYVADGNLTSYTITRVSTDKRATLVINITLFIEYPIEDFDITLDLQDGYTAGQ